MVVIGCRANPEAWKLAQWVAWTNAKLIVIDPLAAAHSRGSLSDAYAARRALKLLKQFCTDHGVTAIVLHHLGNRGKSRRVAESPQLSATASMIMLMERGEAPSSCARPEPDRDAKPCPAEEEGVGGGGREPEASAQFAPSYCARPEPHKDDKTRPAEEEGVGGGGREPEASAQIAPSSCARPEPDNDVETCPAEGEGEGGECRELKASVITLVCRGRGAFANQTLHLRSENPLHYEPFEPKEEKPQPKRGRPSSVEIAILKALDKKAPQSRMQLIDSTGEVPGTVTNAVTRLYKRGAIRDGGKRQNARVYFLDRTRINIAGIS